MGFFLQKGNRFIAVLFAVRMFLSQATGLAGGFDYNNISAEYAQSDAEGIQIVL